MIHDGRRVLDVALAVRELEQEDTSEGAVSLVVELKSEVYGHLALGGDDPVLLI